MSLSLFLTMMASVVPQASVNGSGEPGAAASLPSGSSEAFRRQMLGWNAPVEIIAPLRTMNPVAAPRADGRRLKVSSPFGMRADPITGVERLHAGIDLPSPVGTPVMATAAGTVRFAGWARGYGNLVEIDHSGGVRTLYGHLSRLDVHPSERVAFRQVIGEVGSTGHSTGPHLHYEVRVHGSAVNPLAFVGPAVQHFTSVWRDDTSFWRDVRTVRSKWIGWNKELSTEALPEARLR